jgi:hypothetical protein
MNPHWVGGAEKWCGDPLYKGALHRCTNQHTPKRISSNPNSSELGENRRIQGHSMESRSQKRRIPVDRPDMVAGQHETIPQDRAGRKSVTPNMNK